MSAHEADFRRVLDAAGLVPAEIIMDGALHRCPTADKPNGKDGAYIAHADEPASIWRQNWRTGQSDTWTAKSASKMSPAERAAFKQRIERDRAVREEAAAALHAEKAALARRIYKSAPDCPADHPYLVKKGVPPLGGLRLAKDGRIIVPVLGDDGKIQSLQFIAEGGEKRFLTGGKMAGGFFAIKAPGDKAGPLNLAEGYATGASVNQATGATVLCAFNAGNLLAVAEMARRFYPDREIILCADDDLTEGNPGLTKATEAARAINAKLAVPVFLDHAGRSDFNDMATEQGLEAVRAALDQAKAPEQGPTKPTASGWFPFKVKADGVYFLEDDGEPSWLCSLLEVAARTCNEDGQDHGRLLYVTDARGNRHQWAMPMTMTAGDGNEYRAQLKYLGLEMAPGSKGRQRLELFLNLAKPETWVRCVSRVGWHGRRFVLPDGVYGHQDGEEVILQGGPADHAFRVAGSLQDWQASIGRYCVGNSRLVLAVAVALAAPLLALAGAESGGFHFVGGSSCGKTTALTVAGSICGGGGIKGYGKTWRATDNALEGTCLAHCDTLLCLDEMGQADGRTVGSTAYMIGNGAGKGRARRDGTARKPPEWRSLFLSSGEITLADKIREDGKGRVMAGQQVRVVDIPADAGGRLGLFEELHGFPEGKAFSDYLQGQSKTIYGSPLRAFLEKLTAQYDEAAEAAPALVREFVEEVCPADADGQVKRVAGRFGLVAAAGELGVAFGVLPWPKGEARYAAARCFRDWLVARGGTDAAEVTAGLAQVRAFLEAHGSSRFEDLDGGENQRIVNRAGYRQKVDGQTRYCIFPEAFKREVCAGLNEKTVCAALLKCGALLPDGGRNTRVVRTPDGLKRFYIITPAVFAGNTVSPGNTGNGGNNGVDAGENLLPSGGNRLVTAVTGAVDGKACYHCYRDGNEGGNSGNPHEYSVVTALPVLPPKSDSGEKNQPLRRQSRVVL